MSDDGTNPAKGCLIGFLLGLGLFVAALVLVLR